MHIYKVLGGDKSTFMNLKHKLRIKYAYKIIILLSFSANAINLSVQEGFAM
jgi:hypothetical protein